MDIDIEEQKQKFLEICQKSIKRDGIENLLTWLQKSDFFTAPASTKYHGAYKGGLCQHSMDVLDYACETAAALYDGDLSEESIVIASLFHDLCKVNFYKEDKKNQKIDGVWQEVPCYTIEEKYNFGGHGSKSVFLVQQFMKLKTDEAAAINCHMGFSDVDPGAARSISKAYEAFPLAWIIHVADEAATYLLKR